MADRNIKRRLLLSARDVNVSFEVANGIVEAVRDLSLDIFAGETLALVGESGSGKSAFAKSILDMHQPPFTRRRCVIQGDIEYHRASDVLQLVGADGKTMRAVREKEIGMIFQDAMSSLNPVIRLGKQVYEALSYVPIEPSKRWLQVSEILNEVGLGGTRYSRAFPHQLSGGQRQRAMIAIAAVRCPSLLIADEPTTALDVTVQAQILSLLKRVQASSNMSMLFITHDLGVVYDVAERVAVMCAGRIVELGNVSQVFGDPQNAYTRTLLENRPGPTRKRKAKVARA
ncbi:MAG: ABC transporter ATP-binding protein [Paracoccaceae bacterium]|nr:ABC transporter ATP-binding protein [Paracoccaceae bacterium]